MPTGSSVSITFDDLGISRLRALPAAFRWDQLLEAIGGEVEDQTRHRISNTKTKPDGESWESWSDQYALTRHRGHSLLIDEGHMLGSIEYQVNGDEVMIGSSKEYAVYHQEGQGRMNRPFLGISKWDQEQLDKLIEDWIEALL